MRWDKKLLSRPAVQGLIAAAAAAYIRCVHATTRWHRAIDPAAQTLLDGDRPVIAAFWHNRLMMIPPLNRDYLANRPSSMLISPHRDGLIIGKVVERFGARVIWGSSTHGGRAALQTAVRALQDGTTLGFTPDGPRGPRMRARAGVAMAARRTGVPVLPMAYATSRRRLLRSWDRFHFALPFGRGAFVVGAPLTVAPDEDVEAARARIEAALTGVADAADRLCGVETIPPQNPPAERDGPPTPPAL